MALLPGQTLGAYRIEAQLGQGGMATIYRASHARLGRAVAIKVMHPSFSTDPSFAARFEREAQIVARLEHPHIVPIYDFSEIDGQPYIVMKYISGRTLKAWMESGDAPTLQQIAGVLAPLASALDYAHASGVLHRDIKPSNIIIDDTGTPYLMDFGLARMAQLGDSTLSTDVLLGTPHYISPEQAQGRRDLTARTDIYSFGVVLYELLTGRVPFSADTPFAVIHDHIYRPLPAPSSINPAITPEVEAVLVRALAKDPAERYPSAAALLDAFTAAANASGMAALDPARVAWHRTAPPVFDGRTRAGDAPASAENAPDTLALNPAAAPPETPMPTRAAQAEARQRIERAQRERAAREAREAAVDAAFLPDDGCEPNAPGAPAVRDGVTSDAAGTADPEYRYGTAPGSLPDGEGKPKRRIVSELTSGGPLIRRETAQSLRETGQSLREAGVAVGDVLEELFNPEDEAYAPENDERAIRKRVEKQVEAKREFLGHAAAYVIVNLFLIIMFVSGAATEGMQIGSAELTQAQIEAASDFPWPFLVLFGWGAGLVAHGVSTFYATGDRARRRFSAVRSAYRREFGAQWWTMPRTELKKVRKKAEAPFEAREEFFGHLGVFILINVLLWIIWASGSIGSIATAFSTEAADIPFDFPWPLGITLLWGFGLVQHMLSMAGHNKAQKMIDQEVARERAWLEAQDYDGDAGYERKDKNDFRTAAPPERAAPARPRLTGEGELTSSFVEELRTGQDAGDKRARR
jgi:tRNA A-37 threonylcarbamoyl transferase component Bud32